MESAAPLRAIMKSGGPKSIRRYPEARSCRVPTADKILRLFEPVRRHRLFQRHRLVQTFWGDLTDVQRLVLKLLDVPSSASGRR